MGFIAEFTLSSPLVCETTQAVPGMTFEMEDLQLRGDQPSNYVFWASGGDFEQLEDVLDEDSTVADFVFLTRIRDRLLCRVTFTEGSEQRLAYPTASAYDIVYLSLVQRARGATSVPRSRLATASRRIERHARNRKSRSRSAASTKRGPGTRRTSTASRSDSTMHSSTRTNLDISATNVRHPSRPSIS